MSPRQRPALIQNLRVPKFIILLDSNIKLARTDIQGIKSAYRVLRLDTS